MAETPVIDFLMRPDARIRREGSNVTIACETNEGGGKSTLFLTLAGEEDYAVQSCEMKTFRPDGTVTSKLEVRSMVDRAGCRVPVRWVQNVEVVRDKLVDEAVSYRELIEIVYAESQTIRSDKLSEEGFRDFGRNFTIINVSTEGEKTQEETLHAATSDVRWAYGNPEQPQSNHTRWWVILANTCLAMFVLGYLIFRRRSKRS